jgi:hypothetical protein
VVRQGAPKEGGAIRLIARFSATGSFAQGQVSH